MEEHEEESGVCPMPAVLDQCNYMDIVFVILHSVLYFLCSVCNNKKQKITNDKLKNNNFTYLIKCFLSII